MNVLIAIGLSLLTLVFALTTWIGIPGTFIMALIALIAGWATGFEEILARHILVLFAVAILLEVVEFFLGGLAARISGASRRSAIFAILGGLVGAIIGAGTIFLIGALFGLFMGSFLGAFISEKLDGKTNAEASRAAAGAVIGNVVSKSMKSTAVVIIGIWLIVMLA